MHKTIQIAVREFVATAATRGFIVGILIAPILIAVMIFAMQKLLTDKAPRIEGEVAVIDPTGKIISGLEQHFKPESQSKRREELAERIRDAADELPQALQTPAAEGLSQSIQEQGIDLLIGEGPQLTIVPLEDDADIEREKDRLYENGDESPKRLALVNVHDNAIVPSGPDDSLGTYDLFVAKGMDDRVEREIRSGLRSTIVDERLKNAGLDRKQINKLTTVARVASVTVTKEGEGETQHAFNMLLPAAFMVLLLMSVMMSGQMLMTTTIEEKSNRVAEVLLSAVSPMQLMTGKILGQMCIGFLVLILYSGLGITALFSFAMLNLLDFSLLIYLGIFYVLAYFIIASLMAAIGSSVNELREAQSLLTPVMILIMIPWMLWLPISRDPNSTFSTVLSFIPPINNFVTILRMATPTPPPFWQVWLSIAIGCASVLLCLKFAAKVFRVGLLMYGKPPNFRTLIRWIRLA